MLDDAIFNDRFRELANRVWNAEKKKGTDIEAFARQHFNLSESGFRNWLRGTNASKDFLLVEALGRLAGMTLEETKNYFYGDTAKKPKGSALEEAKALSYIADAPPQGLAKCLRIITDRLEAMPEEQPEPINAIAAEFSRAINAALAEHGLTIEEAAAKLEIEIGCLHVVASGQKLPGYRVASQLAGFIKNSKGEPYTSETLLSLLEAPIVPNPATKKPLHKKRHRASNGAS